VPGSDLRLVIVRHGHTTWSGRGVFTGHRDVPLDEHGLAQADAVARQLHAHRPNAILSSDLRRARQTADAIGAACGLPVTVDPRLREERLGSWEGLTHEEVASRFPGDYKAWRASGVEAIGDREGMLATAERARAAVLAALDTGVPGNGVLVVVTHVNTAIALTCSLLGLAATHWPTVGGLAPASWSLLDHDPRDHWVLTAHNACPITGPG
jgi:probable phosphoglycerate mutase